MARKPATPRQPLHVVKGRPPRPAKTGKIVRAFLVLAILPASLLAQAGHETALAAYRRAVVMLESHKGSIEQVFDRGLRVRDALLTADSRGTTVIEMLSSAQYETLKKEFAGFVISRDEVVFANPDPAYFVDLARQFGDASDRAFFEAYQRTRPTGVWPVWVEQQTDASACTKFGAGDLVASYRAWTGFRQTYPRKYRGEVDGFLGAVEYEMSGSTCACGDADSVRKELEAFDEAFPQTRVGEVIRRRIRELRENRSPIRFGCMAGPASRVLR